MRALVNRFLDAYEHVDDEIRTLCKDCSLIQLNLGARARASEVCLQIVGEEGE